MAFRLFLVNQPHNFGLRDDVDVFNPINRTGILYDGTKFMVLKPVDHEIRDKLAGIDIQSEIFVQDPFSITIEAHNFLKTRSKNGPVRFTVL